MKDYKARFGPFYVLNDTTVIVNGVLGNRIHSQLKQLLREFPDISTMIMERCPGSLDDEQLLKAGILLHKQSVHIHLPQKAKISSGGVDLFLAGTKRTMDRGAKLGVHAWGNDDTHLCATDVPLDDEEHLMYIDYYAAIGWPREEAEKLYVFIINSAPPQKTHYLTGEEIAKYNILTACN